MNTQPTPFKNEIIELDELDTLRGSLPPDDPDRKELDQQREELSWRYLRLAQTNFDKGTPAYKEVTRNLEVVIGAVKKTIDHVEKVAETIRSLARLVTVIDDLLKLGSAISSPMFSPVIEKRATFNAAGLHGKDALFDHSADNPLAENKPVAPVPVEEVLHGIELTQESLIITVATGGCTEEDSFHIDVNKGYTGLPPYLVTVYRVKPDDCLGHFEPIRIAFSRKDLGLEGLVDFRVLNRIGNTSDHRLKP